MNGLTDRLFAIVDLLRGQKQLTTGALAEHFGVSERTIRRDLARLQSLEIEIETLPGRGGGVALSRGSLLPALRFTDDEALVLALGLKRAQRTEEPRLAKVAESAFRRLEHVLTDRLSERMTSLLQTLTLEDTETSAVGEAASGTLLDVSEAVGRRQRLEVRYRSRSSGFSYRKLDPYGVVHVNTHWYVVGHCHARKGQRTFRLDRLEVLRLTGESFAPPKAFDALKTISDSLARAPFPGSLSCRVWLQTDLAEASRHIPAYAAAALLEPREGGVMLTLIAHPEWLWRVALYLLEFPFPVQVIKPPELQMALASLAQRAKTLARGKSA